jgi:hypothetical protein
LAAAVSGEIRKPVSMKQIAFFLLPLLFVSCASIPKMREEERTAQVVIDPEEVLVVETFSVPELIASAEKEESAEVISGVSGSAYKPGAQAKLPAGKTAVKDTIRVGEPIGVEEALDSERVARNAYAWSFVPLTGLFILPGLLVGLIVTLALLGKLKRYAYVTPETLRYKEKARKTLIATTISVIAIYLLIFLLVIGLLAIWF